MVENEYSGLLKAIIMILDLDSTMIFIIISINTGCTAKSYLGL